MPATQVFDASPGRWRWQEWPKLALLTYKTQVERSEGCNAVGRSIV